MLKAMIISQRLISISIEKSEAETEWNLISATEPYEFTNHQYSGIDKSNTVVSGNFSRTESGMLSYIGRVNYSYADRYLVFVIHFCF